jgi:hypothetical protein
MSSYRLCPKLRIASRSDLAETAAVGEEASKEAVVGYSDENYF